LAKFAAMRRASLPGEPVGRRAALRLIVKREIAERLPVRVAVPIDERAMGLPARSGRFSRGYHPRGFRLVSLNEAK